MQHQVNHLYYLLSWADVHIHIIISKLHNEHFTCMGIMHYCTSFLHVLGFGHSGAPQHS